jgi:hypothetical protein
MVLMRIFEHKRDQVTRDWRKQHKEEVSSHSSPNINSVIQSRRMTWRGISAYGEIETLLKFWLDIMKERDHSENICVHERIN